MIDNIATATTTCGKEKVWVPNTEKGWISGELIKKTEEGKWLVKDEEGKEIIIEKDDLNIQNPIIQEGIDDMTSLSHLHEAAVIHNLIKRYEINSIYTYTGSILIAINPYTKLPIYTKEMIESFCDQPVNKLAPHVYSIAESSYREMVNFQKNQSILVSGESGAGKTETTKFLLQYFAAMGEKGNGVNTSLISEEDIKESNNIETQVIKSTPILEAFGNSKTLRNDNSSRFGKFIEIHFHKIKGTIIGAKLETYLLEKSRIVKPPENERSYHIFYQLLASLKDGYDDNLNLSDSPSDFNYLIQSGCSTIDGVNDGDTFIKTEKALKVMGLSDDELLGIWKILSAILHIGNIEFESGKEEDTSIVSDTSSFGKSLKIEGEYNPLSIACELLGCSIDSLKSTFCSRKMKAGNESYTINHTIQQACQARDSLSMFLYSRLFDWLVIRINQSIDKSGGSSGDNKDNQSYLFIGILDIYGFESFESNSFEQFTINYANEKLQNQFNHQIFKLEQKEYEKEKIDWSYIEFDDNQDCIDLIEKKPLGILSILDEESQFPKSTPTTLCTKLFSNHSKSKHFEKARFSQTHFIIEHYAGKVSYDTNLFLEKNKDFIITEQVNALESSNWEFITNLLQTLSKKMNGGSSSKSSNLSASSTGQSSAAGKSTFKFTSVSSQFKESLNLLMNTINNTNPHYIRCIKPNTEKRANSFDNVMVLHQLRCSGVIEQLRISRSGYPSRLPYDNFLKRYRLIISNSEDSKELKTMIEKSLTSSGGCDGQEIKKPAEFMIDKLSIDEKSVQFGLTKLFFKAGIIANLELLRSQTLINSATFIQKIWRGYHDRKSYKTIKDSSILLQSLIRMYLSQLNYQTMVEENSSIHLQSLLRSMELEKQFNQILSSTIHIQSLIRSNLDSIEFNKYLKRIKNIIKIQSIWRSKLAKREFKQVKLDAKSLKNVVAEKNKLVNKLDDIKLKLDSESKLTEKIKIENQQLSTQFDNINLEKDQLLLKLSNLQSEYDQFKQESESEISNLKKQLSEQNINISRIDHIEEEEYEEYKDVILSPKQHKSEPYGRSYDYNLSSTASPPRSRENINNSSSNTTIDGESAHEGGIDEDVVPKKEFTLLEKEYNELKEKDETNIKYIESLKLQIGKLEEKVKKQTLHPRSLLPGIPTSTSTTDSPRIVYTKSSFTNDNIQHISPTTSINSISSPNINLDNNVKSLSYKDFTNSGEIQEQQQLQQQGISPNDNQMPIVHNSSSISDLISALNFNNCQLESGKYLVDLILKNHDTIISKYVQSDMGGIPEPAFILSRCFLKNIYDTDFIDSIDSIEKNVTILIYFCDKVEEVVYRDPKSNCSALCYWFSNFYTLFNIMECYNQDSKESSTAYSDQDKAIIEKLKITLQTMIVKAHKNVVKNITDYIQPILHKSLNDTTSEIDFMDPITNYLNQIEISLSPSVTSPSPASSTSSLSFNQSIINSDGTSNVCEINNQICKLLFEQLFSFINAMIFNEILLRKDLCCLRSSIPIKMNISELEHWVKLHHGKEWSVSVCDKLKLLKEVVYILMIDKTQLQNEELRKEICPTLSIAQLKQLLTMYSPDVDSFEDPIPLEILTSLMDSPNYNPDENILLDLSKIFTLKFNNNNYLEIDLDAIESVQYSCDDLVSNIVKKNIEIVSSLSNSQKLIKK